MASEELKVELAFLCGAKHTLPLRLIIDDNCTASAAHTLKTGDPYHAHNLRRVETFLVET